MSDTTQNAPSSAASDDAQSVSTVDATRERDKPDAGKSDALRLSDVAITPSLRVPQSTDDAREAQNPDAHHKPDAQHGDDQRSDDQPTSRQQPSPSEQSAVAAAPTSGATALTETVLPEAESSDHAAPTAGDVAARSVEGAAVSEEWSVIAETVAGASHLRAGIPNQDAVLCVRGSTVRLPVIVAVSDGHGSDKCFRSHLGSRFAVRVGANLLDELYADESIVAASSDGNPEHAQRLRESLSREYLQRWRTLVEADIARSPLQESEFAKLVEKDGVAGRKAVEANPLLAYGATALAFLITDVFALYLQLGDGEILTVTDAGEVAPPLPPDARLIANETTSLCSGKADDFRMAIKSIKDNAPALILLTTDGYANSFSNDEGFYQVGTDVLAMLREQGFDAVNRSVKTWLEEATAQGSGDDCTLALIVRADAESSPMK